MQFKGTKGYLKDKVLKTDKGISLVNDYKFLLNGCVRRRGGSADTKTFIKENGKLYELEKTNDYVTKEQLIKKYGVQGAEKRLKGAYPYLKLRQFTEKEKEKLTQALVRILTSGTYTIRFDPDTTGRNNYRFINENEFYQQSDNRKKFNFNFSKFFEKGGVNVKALLNNPTFGRTNHLSILFEAFNRGRLPFNMHEVVQQELFLATGTMSGKIIGVRFDKKTSEILRSLNDSLSVYSMPSEKRKKKDLKIDVRALALLDVEEGIEVTGTEIKNKMNKDAELEKIAAELGTSWGTAPKRYRKEINGGERTKVRSEIKKIVNGSKDVEELELGKPPKDAGYDFW